MAAARPSRTLSTVATDSSRSDDADSTIALPIITSVFQDEYPLTDSYLMPVVGVSLTVLAALVNVLAVWKGHQRSVVSLVAMFLTVMASLSFGLIVIGEGLSGA